MWRINWEKGRDRSVSEETSEETTAVIEARDDGSLDQGDGRDGDGGKCEDARDILGIKLIRFIVGEYR